MLLSMQERLLMLSLLPEKEGISVIRVVHDLKQALAPSEEESQEYLLQEIEGKVYMDSEKAQAEKEITIGEKAMDVCVKALKDANNARRLPVESISLYDKFVKE